ncbi:4083_t:CDS:10 [Entrophospora sp. SA101]|nr:4083_t:CDS:10 [Entrophospora sp. SA101]CAJ0897338.1 1063_t:CDS:10 [Entrophospora sp. SA101]CAJ0897747.1 19172_t:CDS:10 [Entrophospora sp. SA101]CAJ0898412.1 13476_t:CDS:10 [Entrophospora sp. SA101]
MLRNILLKNKESSPELLSRVIRLQVELTKPDNNIFSFPDLCKEAGIELPNPHSSLYPSTSESDSESLEILENSEKYANEENNTDGKKKRAKRVERYDISDPFVDDSDLPSFQSDKDKIRPKIDGYYVWRGPLVLENSKYKRKAKAGNDEEMENSDKENPIKRRHKCKAKAKDDKKVANGDEGMAMGNKENLRKRQYKRDEENLKPRKKWNKKSDKSDISGKVKKTRRKAPPKNTRTPTIKNQDVFSSSHTSLNKQKSQQQQRVSLDLNNSMQIDTQDDNNHNLVDPLHPELQEFISFFKNEVSKENFGVRSKFPQVLNPNLTRLLCKAYELDEFNDILFNVLTNILPYNKFTRLCYRTIYPKTIYDSKLKKSDLISQLKSSVDEIIPDLLNEYNDKLARLEPVSSPSLPPPSSSPSSLNNTDAENIGCDKKTSKSKKPDSILPKRFCWNNRTKSLLYEIIRTELSIVEMTNQLAESEEKPTRLSELTCRKNLYQHLLTIWPDGWMTTYEIGRVHSGYKKKHQLS